MLYPRESESREIKDLSGIWAFKTDPSGRGRTDEWFRRPLEEAQAMPVPASYNDLTQDAAIRDHIGEVWYENTVFIPASWADRRVVVRVGAASHHGTVWINGREVVRHKGGFLPFEADISSVITCGNKNRVTIAVDNVQDWSCLPPGELKTFDEEGYPPGHRHLAYYPDFFNYSGIHRPVLFYTTPTSFIEDLAVTTTIAGADGVVDYEVSISGGGSPVSVRLLDEEGVECACGVGASGRLLVPDAHCWAPGAPYLYTLEVRFAGETQAVADMYRLPVGIRTVEVVGAEFRINGKPFYFRGFGKHEDADLRGKGLDHVTNVKDFNLLAWIGANSFRTSHYPYADEIMNLADERGVVVIDELPAVGFNLWSLSERIFREGRVDEHTLEHHRQVLRELVQRDRNHPCVAMWSLANEATTYEEGALPYFKVLVDEARALDPTRPLTIVENVHLKECRTASLVDVICLNRYNAWYADSGRLDIIEYQLEQELRAWYAEWGKPMIISEYGADAIAGFHQDPPAMFTEEYQCEMLKHFHNVFDRLDFMVGEHVWNFADFATKQSAMRVHGNRKGVFTRQRQPKAAAHLLRERWTSAAAR